ncbi:hypothetical protein ABT215_16920 [Streptomyces sp900105755]|uniref:hypothetical protein n=1 Tax=Streptomyces sp. 900105755 TaxID=3154389 RepID=UPI003316CAAB
MVAVGQCDHESGGGKGPADGAQDAAGGGPVESLGRLAQRIPQHGPREGVPAQGPCRPLMRAGPPPCRPTPTMPNSTSPAALDDPATGCRPLEEALAHLDLGEWLRRRRRSAEARPHPKAAPECFRHLDARPWTERATAKRRRRAGAATGPAPVGELAPQERQIAELTAQDLTNAGIASGITAGARLRDALAQEDQGRPTASGSPRRGGRTGRRR